MPDSWLDSAFGPPPDQTGVQLPPSHSTASIDQQFGVPTAQPPVIPQPQQAAPDFGVPTAPPMQLPQPAPQAPQQPPPQQAGSWLDTAFAPSPQQQLPAPAQPPPPQNGQPWQPPGSPQALTPWLAPDFPATSAQALAQVPAQTTDPNWNPQGETTSNAFPNARAYEAFQTWLGRGTERGLVNFAGRITNAGLTAVGATDTRKELRQAMQDFAEHNAKIDEDNNGLSNALAGGTAMLTEFAPSTLAGPYGPMAYMGVTSAGDTAARMDEAGITGPRKYMAIAASTAIDTAGFYLGAKYLGAPMQKLLGALGGAAAGDVAGAATQTAAEKAAQLAAWRYPIGPALAKLAVGANTQGMLFAGTEAAHYMTDVGLGVAQWDPNTLYDRLWQGYKSGITVGGISHGLHGAMAEAAASKAIGGIVGVLTARHNAMPSIVQEAQADNAQQPPPPGGGSPLGPGAVTPDQAAYHAETLRIADLPPDQRKTILDNAGMKDRDFAIEHEQALAWKSQHDLLTEQANQMPPPTDEAQPSLGALEPGAPTLRGDRREDYARSYLMNNPEDAKALIDKLQRGERITRGDVKDVLPGFERTGVDDRRQLVETLRRISQEPPAGPGPNAQQIPPLGESQGIPEGGEVAPPPSPKFRGVTVTEDTDLQPNDYIQLKSKDAQGNFENAKIVQQVGKNHWWIDTAQGRTAVRRSDMLSHWPVRPAAEGAAETPPAVPPPPAESEAPSGAQAEETQTQKGPSQDIQEPSGQAAGQRRPDGEADRQGRLGEPPAPLVPPPPPAPAAPAEPAGPPARPMPDFISGATDEQLRTMLGGKQGLGAKIGKNATRAELQQAAMDAIFGRVAPAVTRFEKPPADIPGAPPPPSEPPGGPPPPPPAPVAVLKEPEPPPAPTKGLARKGPREEVPVTGHIDQTSQANLEAQLLAHLRSRNKTPPAEPGGILPQAEGEETDPRLLEFAARHAAAAVKAGVKDYDQFVGEATRGITKQVTPLLRQAWEFMREAYPEAKLRKPGAPTTYEGRRIGPLDASPERGKTWLDEKIASAPKATLKDPKKAADWIRNNTKDLHYWRFLHESDQTLDEAVKNAIDALPQPRKQGLARKTEIDRANEQLAELQHTPDVAPEAIRSIESYRAAIDKAHEEGHLSAQGLEDLDFLAGSHPQKLVQVFNEAAKDRNKEAERLATLKMEFQTVIGTGETAKARGLKARNIGRAKEGPGDVSHFPGFDEIAQQVLETNDQPHLKTEAYRLGGGEGLDSDGRAGLLEIIKNGAKQFDPPPEHFGLEDQARQAMHSLNADAAAAEAARQGQHRSDAAAAEARLVDPAVAAEHRPNGAPVTTVPRSTAEEPPPLAAPAPAGEEGLTPKGKIARGWLESTIARAPPELADDPGKIANWIQMGFGQQWYKHFLMDTGQNLRKAVGEVLGDLGRGEAPPPQPAINPEDLRPLNEAEKAIVKKANARWSKFALGKGGSGDDVVQESQARQKALTDAGIVETEHGLMARKGQPEPPAVTAKQKLPPLTGDEFEKRVRATSLTPEEGDGIIALAKANAAYRGESFDDYVAKHFADVLRTDVSKSGFLRQEAERKGLASNELPDTLAQKQRRVRGEVEFLKQDGRAIIRAFRENQNLTTLAHELGHVFRRTLLPEDLSAAERALGVENGKWSLPKEEEFARHFERYLRDGEAPTPQLRTVFQRFKEWLINIYRNLAGSPLKNDIPPELKAIFDKMLTPQAENVRDLAVGAALGAGPPEDKDKFTLDRTLAPSAPKPVATSIPTTQPNLFAGLGRGSLPGQGFLDIGEEGPTVSRPPSDNEVLGLTDPNKPSFMRGLPGAAAAEKFVGEDIKPRVEEVRKNFEEAEDTIRKLFNPGSRGLRARAMAMLTRQYTAELAHRVAIAQAKFGEAVKFFDLRSDKDNYDFFDRMEKGQPQNSEAETKFAGQMRQLNDEVTQLIRDLGTGKLTHFIENYMGHIWKDPKKAGEVYRDILARRPVEGSRAFLKKRTIPYQSEGIERGLEPVTSNPAKMVLLKLQEQYKYLGAHELMEHELKPRGWAQFQLASKRTPEGLSKYNDNMFTVFGARKHAQGGQLIRGYYYGPQEVSQILNNYLGPGLRERSGLFRSFLGASNMMNRAQLGISAFHAGFTGIDAVTSNVAMAIEHLTHGEVFKGLATLAKSPIAPFSAYRTGKLLQQEYRTPGSVGGEYTKMVDAFVKSGGRAEMDKFYANHMIDGFKAAIRAGNYPGAILRAPFAAVELASKPIMEGMVPRLKMGVYYQMMAAEMDRNPSMSLDQLREAGTKAWDSVENRLGQMTHDNTFINNTIKDLLFGSFRSVGWNLGSIREGAGAVRDTAQQIENIRNGRAPEMTHRMAYALALPMTVGAMGATYMYLATGKKPEELRDYFFPQTGGVDRYGRPERISLPSYMKDVYAMQHDPISTVTHKLNPLISTVAEMLTNQDYYGTKIVNEDDPLMQKVRQEIAFAGKQFTPFSVQGAMRLYGEGAPISQVVQPAIGILPAPASVVKSPAENMAQQLSQARIPAGGRTSAEAARSDAKRVISKKIAAQGPAAASPDIQQALQAGTIRPGDVAEMVNTAGRPQLERSMNSLSADDAMKVWRVASPDEQDRIYPAMYHKILRSGSLSDDDRQDLLKELGPPPEGVNVPAVKPAPDPVGRAAFAATEPPPKRRLGEKVADYRTRQQAHAASVDQARRALAAFGAQNPVAVRTAIVAEQRRRGAGTARINRYGGPSAYQARFGRIRQAVTPPQ